MCRVLLLLCLISCSLENINAAKILSVFPLPYHSHQMVFRPIIQELVKRGHDVTVITPLPAFTKETSPKNLREIDIHDICYGELDKYKNSNNFLAEDNYDTKTVFTNLNMIASISEKIFKHEEIATLIEAGVSNKFDIILIESIVRPMFIFSHVFNAPITLVSSFSGVHVQYQMMGAPIHFFLYPTMIQKNIKNLSIFDKLKTLLLIAAFDGISAYYRAKENSIIKQALGDETPNLRDMRKNLKLLLLNVHHIWDSNRPVPPGIVYMGGLHQNPGQELPKDLQSYLDNSKNGVIYLSFGSTIPSNHTKSETIKAIVNVLSKLPYNVLWKWDADELPGRTDNIKISKWFPQSDILRHPKILLFITQCGLQSTDEAITAGVPLLGLPMIADQYYNAERYEIFKIGIKMDINTMDEEELTDAITKLINNDSYRQNIVKLRNLMNDQLNTPLERAIYWIEHVIKHGADHIKSPAAGMSLIEYIDVPLVLTLLVIVLGIIILFSYTSLFVIKWVLRRVFGEQKFKKV